jgi:hypothetical protein
MKFRRLYWVAEQIERDGKSKVTGVYTSIQDLIQRGLRWCDEDRSESSRFVLTLVKPDSFNCPFGEWTSPEFGGLIEALQQFVETNEYTQEEIYLLQEELEKFVKEKAPAG